LARGPRSRGPNRHETPPRAPIGWRPRDASGRPTIDVGTWDGGDRVPPPIGVDLAPASRALRGCLMRLVLLAVLLMLGLFGVISLLGGSLLRLIY
jgi:hypothetical protein